MNKYTAPCGKRFGMRKLLCFAHRGASGHAPENTLLSVERALLLGTDWIEVDVYAVRGKLIVIHDERLESTTNGSGSIFESSIDYIRSVDAGQGQYVPYLHEIFDRVNGKAGINVELKGNGAADMAVPLINGYMMHPEWSHEKVLVSSFNHTELMRVREVAPRIRIGVLVKTLPHDWTRVVEELGAYSIHCRADAIHEIFVQEAHMRGLKIFVYTVNSLRVASLLKHIKVDGIFTDYPEIITQQN